MIERLVDKYYWSDRYSRVSTNLALYIGNKLCSGVSLPDALKMASEEIDNKRQSSALSTAAYVIKKGESLQYALGDYRLKLKQKDRYVLASPIPDKLKGIILRNWSESKYHGSNVISYLMIFLTTFIICNVAFFASVFVIPQFYEILMGMNVPINDFFKSIYRIGPGFIPLLMFGFFGFFIFFIIFSVVFNGIKKKQEEADLLSLLASVKRSEQLEILDMMANAKCFPKIFKNIRRVVDSLKQGEKQENSFTNIGLSPYTEWFLNLSYFEKDRTVLKEGAMIINEKIMLSSLSMIKFIEVLTVILQSTFFALMAYILYFSLNNIVSGCFA